MLTLTECLTLRLFLNGPASAGPFVFWDGASQSPSGSAGGWPSQWVPHSFAHFANEWALDFGKALDRTTLDFQRPLL